MLTRRGRTVRLVAFAVVLAGLAAGTAWGDDEHYPFGPFRMYSTRNDPDGTVAVVQVQVELANGVRARLPARAFGVRPAEIDGQLIAAPDDSAVAGRLAAAYENLDNEPPLRTLQVIRGFHVLRDGRAVDYYEQVLGSWPRAR